MNNKYSQKFHYPKHTHLTIQKETRRGVGVVLCGDGEDL